MSTLIDACPECGAEVDAIVRAGDPSRRDLFIPLVANGVRNGAQYLLEPCGHQVAGSQLRLASADGFVHVEMRRAS
jgi:hypothetical protein